MRHTIQPLPFAAAWHLAQQLQQRVAPICQRVLIVGSLRRQQSLIEEIDLLVVPSTVHTATGIAAALEAPGYQCAVDATGVHVHGLALPTQIIVETDVSRWGVHATRRTGTTGFAQWLITPRHAGGGLPDHLHYDDDRIWNRDIPLETTEELSVFRTLGLPWVAPTQRVCRLPDLFQQGLALYAVNGTVVTPFLCDEDDADVQIRTDRYVYDGLEDHILFTPCYVVAPSAEAAQDALLHQVADQMMWHPSGLYWDTDAGCGPTVIRVTEDQQVHLMGMPTLPGWEEQL